MAVTSMSRRLKHHPIAKDMVTAMTWQLCSSRGQQLAFLYAPRRSSASRALACPRIPLAQARQWLDLRTAAVLRCRAGCQPQASSSSSVSTVDEDPPGSVADGRKRTPETAPSASVSGDAIRERFLRFFAERGHTKLPSASLIPDDPTILLTIAGMIPFKPIFLGQRPRVVPRATSTQKCVRTNDIENVGVTARHHTFFEMLGNFSFGDYFKEEAVKWAWELSTVEFALPIKHLWISVYEEDDEATQLWKNMGVAESRIVKMGTKDNFWSSGPTGPCGPCTELYYDFHPERGEENIDLDDDSRFIEFYNVVFMQYNRDGQGQLVPLKNPNIDTGMGLERMAQILQKKPNNYETDLIFPIIEKAATLANKDYFESTDKEKQWFKVIGDHIRACVYLISDGVTPSNIGRGYIVRRLIRRIVRCTRQIGTSTPSGEHVLPLLAEVAIELSAPVDSLVQENSERIKAELAREEQRFVITLEKGEKILHDFIQKAKGNSGILDGKEAFLLYDSFGFPVEMTIEIAEEEGVNVDMKGFEAEMESQRAQSKAAQEKVKLAVGNVLADVYQTIGQTEFLGYHVLQSSGSVRAIVNGDGELIQESIGSSSRDVVSLVFDRTPFYAEGGGQVGDNGLVYSEDESTLLGTVTDVQTSAGDIFLHTVTLEPDVTISVEQNVWLEVDEEKRRKIRANHTATHLLQAALKKIIGQDVSQAGSLVNSEKLRFDFNCPKPIKGQDIAEIEGLINQWILQSQSLQTFSMSLSAAKEAGAVAMFGEKYGEEVRVIDVPGISMELCGGTHVENTIEIGSFRITSESSISSGVRRIEAVAGPGIYALLRDRDDLVKSLSSSLKVRPDEISNRIDALQEELKEAKKSLDATRSELAVAKCESLASSSEKIKDFDVLISRMDGMDAGSLKAAALSLKDKLSNGVILLASVNDGKILFVAAMSAQAIASGLKAGQLVGKVAKICGGGGGGKPDFAQAGGKDATKVEEALILAREEVVQLS